MSRDETLWFQTSRVPQDRFRHHSTVVRVTIPDSRLVGVGPVPEEVGTQQSTTGGGRVRVSPEGGLCDRKGLRQCPITGVVSISSVCREEKGRRGPTFCCRCSLLTCL